MQMTGEYQIPAARDIVWRGLNDPEILRICIPGCESVEKISDTEFTARVVVSVGPVKAKFSGKVALANLDPPRGYTIAGEGQGGVAGFGKGSADVRLEEDGDAATVLRYTAQASVGGKLAQIGARLVDATAKKLADEFFGRFAATIAPPAAVAEPAPVAAPVSGPEIAMPIQTAEPAPAPPAARFALRPVVWIPALIALVAVLLWMVTRG